MDWILVIARLIHILAGVYWAGATFMLVLFVTPTVTAIGPDGQKFMRRFVQTWFPRSLAITGGLTALSGLWLYWRVFGLRTSYLSTGTGLFITIGSIAGIFAVIAGSMAQSPDGHRMEEIGNEIRAAGGPPSSEQIAEIQTLSQKINNGSVATAILLLITVIGMSIAQYIFF